MKAISLLLLALAAAPAAAQLGWSPPSIVALPGQPSQHAPQLVPDGQDGWYLAAPSAMGVSLQRLDAAGRLLWSEPSLLTPGPVESCSALPRPLGVAISWCTGQEIWSQFTGETQLPSLPQLATAHSSLHHVSLAPCSEAYQLAWQEGASNLCWLPLSSELAPLHPVAQSLSYDCLGYSACPRPAGLVLGWLEAAATHQVVTICSLAPGNTWLVMPHSGSDQLPVLVAPGPQDSLWCAWLQASPGPFILVTRLDGQGRPLWSTPAAIAAASLMAIASRGDQLALLGTGQGGLCLWCLNGSGAAAWPPLALAAAGTHGALCASDDGWWCAWCQQGTAYVLPVEEGGTAHWQAPWALEAVQPEPLALAPARAGVVAAWAALDTTTSPAVRAARFSTDTSPPPAPLLQAPPAGSYLFPGSARILSWQAGDDPQSGTLGCRLGVGSIAGAADPVGWREVAAQGTLDLSTLGLAEGAVCCVSVQARNGAGLLSTPAAAGPYTWDQLAPRPTLTVPPDPLAGVVRIKASAADAVSPSVALQLLLDGAAVASGTSSLSWDWDTRPLSVAEGRHVIALLATDQAGHTARQEHPVIVDNATFDDVPKTSVYWPYVEAIYRERISTGCSPRPPLFCPTGLVTRELMAAFLCRALGLAPLRPAIPTFADVPPTRGSYGYVEALAAAGITRGCRTEGSKRYFCPTGLLTREQMALQLCRAVPIATYSNPVATFSDVPKTYPYYIYVEGLYRAGVTQGCATLPRRYCPASGVSREMMAVFLCRAFKISTGP